MKSLCSVWLSVTPWTVAYQASLFMGFSRQEYSSGLPFPSPGDLLDPGIEPGSSTLQADALSPEPPSFFFFFFFNLYTWGQSVVEVMKTMVTSFKRSHAWTATLSGPNPASGHHRPIPHWRQLDTHGHVWVSLSWGHCSFSWVLVCRRFCLCPPRICFPSAV